MSLETILSELSRLDALDCAHKAEKASLAKVIGKKLREHRESLGLTLQQLGERIGCSKQNLFHMEQGRKIQSEYWVNVILTYSVNKVS